MIVERLASRRKRRLLPVGNHEVRSRLEPFARARTRQAMPSWAMRATVAGVAVDVVVLLVASAALSLHAIPRSVSPSVLRFAVDDRYWMIAPPLVLAALLLLAAGLRRVPLARIAREADSLLDLRERLSTALELEDLAEHAPPQASGEASGRLALWQRADAVDTLRRHEPTEAYPIRLPRRDVIGASVACLCLFALVLAPAVTGGTNRQLAELTAQAEAERLSTLADQVANDSSLSPQDRAALSAALAQAAQDLQANASDGQSALSALGTRERSLAQQASAGGDNSQLALARVADALDQATASKGVASKLDGGDYAGAAQELSQLGDQAGALGQSDRSALSDALQKAASATSKLDPQLSDKLAQAASSLSQAGQSASGGPQSAFSQAGDALNQAGQSAARQAALDQALSALQGAQASLGSAQSSPNGLGPAQAGAPDGGQPDPSQTDSTDSQGGQSAQGSGQEAANAGSGQTGGQNGQSTNDSTAASGAGKGSLAKQGQNPSGDFRSRVVRVPTDQFGDPSVSAGQASSEGPIGEATVDYQQVLASYTQRATDAMSQGNIPASLKDLVSAYFVSLDSGRGSPSAAPRGAAK